MLEMLDSGESMGCCRENMQSQKRIKLERPSGRPKWKAKIGGKRLKSKLDSTGCMAKSEFGLETYVGSSQGQKAIRFRFRMRLGTTDKRGVGFLGRIDVCCVIGRR